MSTFHRFKYFTQPFPHFKSRPYWNKRFLFNSFGGVAVLSSCRHLAAAAWVSCCCQGAGHGWTAPEHSEPGNHANSGLWGLASPPTPFGKRFPTNSAPGCSVHLLCAVFQAHFPGMVESRGARSKHWEVMEPTVLMGPTGKVQSQPCKIPTGISWASCQFWSEIRLLLSDRAAPCKCPSL